MTIRLENLLLLRGQRLKYEVLSFFVVCFFKKHHDVTELWVPIFITIKILNFCEAACSKFFLDLWWQRIPKLFVELTGSSQ